MGECKICHNNCEGEYCFKHKPKKPLSSGTKLSSRSRLKSKPKTEEQKMEQRNQRDKDIEFYNEIWQERPHYCEVCGKWLGNHPSTAFFDHLLNKSLYPELRYEVDNIILVDLECHDLKTRGFPRPEHRERINLAKEKFNIT